MPLTMARPSPAPRPTAGSRTGVRAGLPCQATSKTRSMSSLEMPPHASVTLSSIASPTCRPVTSTTPSAGVCRIALMSRLDTTRDSSPGSAVTKRPVVHVPAEAYAAGARDRVGAGQRLADHVAQRDRLEVQRQHAGVDPGELEEVVDHAHHPVDLGPDLAVVAGGVVGQPVLERLGHRAQSRPGASAGRGTPTTPARAATPRAAARARATPAGRRAVMASSSLSSWSSAGPREPASNRPLSPNRRASSRMVRDHRANAVPMTNETPIATTPATVTTQSTTSRSWSERNIARAVPTTPATTASTAVRATTPTCQRKDRRRTTHARSSPSRPAAAGPGGADPDDRPLVVRHRGSHR